MKKYFLQSNGQHIGPYSAEDLRMMSISFSTPVWYDGLGSWKNAGDIPELNHLFAAPVPPPSYYQPPVYQQPVTPYYHTTHQPVVNSKKKSRTGLVLLLVGGILLFTTGISIYFYKLTKETKQNIREAMRQLREKDANEYDKTFPYSYDTSGITTVEQSPQDTSAPVKFAEVMPEFPGGPGALNAFIRNTIKYPQAAKNRGIQGTVYVRFTIEKNGEVTNHKIARGVSAELDSEAMRMVKKMPRWKPGTMNGHPVRIEMTQPIRFVLQ